MTTFAADCYLLVAAIGLAVPVAYGGLPVLGQGAFVSVGAFGTMLLARAGVPLGLAVLAAVAIAAAAGYATGLVAGRLAGVALALATWTLAWLAYEVLVGFPSVSGGAAGLIRPTPARVVSPSLGVSLRLTPAVHVGIAVVLAMLGLVGLRRLGRGPLGLDLGVMRASPALADALGVRVARRRREVLALAAALGAIGGAGQAVLLGVVAANDYTPLLSLQLFVAVVLAGARWWAPLLGTIIIERLPSLASSLASATGAQEARLSGVVTAALLALVLLARGRFEASAWVARPDAHVPAENLAPLPPAAGVALRAEGLRAEYDARPVLDGVGLDVRPGEVHAVIGPNGSGKSTLLRVLSGALPARGGRLFVGADPVPPTNCQADRVRSGVARTFQTAVAVPGLSVLEQAAVGAQGRERSRLPALRHMFATPGGRRASRQRVAVAAGAVAAAGLAGRGAGVLSAGDGRLLQVGRIVATGARVLLLDEPAAGMSAAERKRLIEVLRGLASRGHGVVLVEHDMGLVGAVADRVTVLVAGAVVATGTPAEVRMNPQVQAAYLGRLGA